MGINWGNPITRQYLLEMLPDNDPRLPANVREFRDLNSMMDESGQTQRIGGAQWASDYLDVLDKYGASSTLDLSEDVRSQLPHQGFYYSGGGQTFGDQLKSFVTSPAFLTLASGLGAVYAAPAGAAGAGAADLGTAVGAAGELGAGGALGSYGSQLAASQTAGAGTAAATTAGGSNTGNIQVAAAEPTTMTDVGPGLFGGGDAATVGASGEVGALDSLFGTTTGYGNLSQSELAAMIESGTMGSAGASLEGLAGVGAGGGWSGLTSGTLGSNLGTGAGNILGSTVQSATGGAIPAAAVTEATGLGDGGGGGTGAATNNTGGGGTGTGGQGYQIPWESLIEGLIGTYFKGEQISDLTDAINAAAAKADPFASQRPQYQQQFSSLTSNPSNFFNDPAVSGIIDFGQDRTARKMSAMGYNMSGNMAHELTKTAQREAFGQYIPYTNMIGQAAGAQLGTGGAGQVAGQGAAQVAGLQGQYQAGLGSIFSNVARGQQPTQPGAKPNQTLMQYFLA